MPTSRRKFLTGSSAVALYASLFPRDVFANPANSIGRFAADHGGRASQLAPLESLADPELIRAISSAAVDAAKAAGAAYADVRLTRTVSQNFFIGSTVAIGGVTDSQYAAIGVRALVGGVWGYSCSPVWSVEEGVALAQSAVTRAGVASRVLPPKVPVELATAPAQVGTWSTPISIDPFSIPIRERIDFLTSWMEFANHVKRGVSHGVSQMSFHRQERAFANTEGAYLTQTFFESGGEFPLNVSSADWKRPGGTQVFAPGLKRAAKGWEMFIEAKIPEAIPAMIEDAEESMQYPFASVNIGKYDILFDSESVANLFDATLGTALEMDLIMGQHANSTGTSYLNGPPELVLNRTLANDSLTITANRTVAGQLATVKWDDDGVTPTDFTVIEHGQLREFPTTREAARFLSGRDGKPRISNGCSGADSAMKMPVQCAPNYSIQPGAGGAFGDMVKEIRNGYAVMRGSTKMDFQARTGVSYGTVIRQIINGRLNLPVNNAAIMVESSEIWANLSLLGGAASSGSFPMIRTKGQPARTNSHTVTSVPAIFKGVTVMDLTRNRV